MLEISDVGSGLEPSMPWAFPHHPVMGTSLPAAHGPFHTSLAMGASKLWHPCHTS